MHVSFLDTIFYLTPTASRDLFSEQCSVSKSLKTW